MSGGPEVGLGSPHSRGVMLCMRLRDASTALGVVAVLRPGLRGSSRRIRLVFIPIGPRSTSRMATRPSSMAVGTAMSVALLAGILVLPGGFAVQVSNRRAFEGIFVGLLTRRRASGKCSDPRFGSDGWKGQHEGEGPIGLTGMESAVLVSTTLNMSPLGGTLLT